MNLLLGVVGVYHMAMGNRSVVNGFWVHWMVDVVFGVVLQFRWRGVCQGTD